MQLRRSTPIRTETLSVVAGRLPRGQTVNQASTTTTITSDNPDPSIVGQPYDVHWNVTPQYSGTPTGTVTVSDGTDSCSAAVSAGFCTLTSTTVGSKTLTATYSGDTNFITSSDTEMHGVQYTFVGFLQPIDNLPMNSSKAGQTIPVKWQLKDSDGNLISDLIHLLRMGCRRIQITCSAARLMTSSKSWLSPGSTVFRFDGTQFIYNWQTSKSWAGTCRLMTVTLSRRNDALPRSSRLSRSPCSVRLSSPAAAAGSIPAADFWSSVKVGDLRRLNPRLIAALRLPNFVRAVVPIA